MGATITGENRKKFMQYAKASPRYRMEKFFKIIGTEASLVPFILNGAQADFYGNITKTSREYVARDILLKGRQIGFTTFCLLFYLDHVMWNPMSKASFISLNADKAEESFEKIKVAWENFPLQSLFPKVEITKKSIKFGHMSSLSVTTKARSTTANFLHISELGSISRHHPSVANEIITGAFPAVHKGGRIIVESTAEGVGGVYYDLWQSAWKNRFEYQPGFGFKPHFYAWYWDPKYTIGTNGFILSDEDRALRKEIFDDCGYEVSDGQLAWHKQNKRVYLDKMRQEFPSNPYEAFLASGRPVFDSKYLKISCEPQDAIPGRFYAMGVDPADLGKDNSIIKIIDLLSGEIVFNGKYNVHVSDLPDIMIDLGYRYNTCIIGWERNGVGAAIRGLMLKSNYPNLFVNIKQDKLHDEVTENVGVYTTKTLKEKMIHELKTNLANGKIKISDSEDLSELAKFQITESGKMEGGDGSHDDRVMALAIVNHISENTPVSELKPPEQKRFFSFFDSVRNKPKKTNHNNW